MPLVGVRHKSATEGIGVDVVDLFADVMCGFEVSIVSAAALPETVLASSVRLTVLPAFKEGGALVADPQEGTPGDRGLDRKENPADLDS